MKTPLDEALRIFTAEEYEGYDDIEGPAYGAGWRDAMRRCSTVLRNLKPKEESVRNEVLEEASKAVEALRAPEVVFSPGTPLSLIDHSQHPNRIVEKAASCVRSLKRPDDVTKQSDS